VSQNPAAQDEGGPKRFGTTRWSVVLSSAATDDSEKGREALSHLCKIYWRPIFAFICQRGYNTSDAQDLTQDFFMNIVEGNLLQQADPARGRFRSLLLRSVQNFLIDKHDKQMAQRRGGGMQFVQWDAWVAEAPSHLSLPTNALDSWTAERLFDVRWAATVVEQALRRLREECELRGRRRVFDALSCVLSAERGEVSYTAVGKALGVSESAVKRLVSQLRQRYRALLRDEVARTVETDAAVEDEIRYLCAALAAGAE
jgi:RNA polymerase sigma-70 factor (ECF subfamily)